jgi:hypothetical protein
VDVKPAARVWFPPPYGLQRPLPQALCDLSMAVFPSKHERTITIAILSFCAGLGLGLAVTTGGATAKDLIPAAFTLIAAFLGAWVAFSLEASSRKRERRDAQLEAANKLLFALSERLSPLLVFKHDFIDPIRDLPSRMLEMQPVAHYREPTSKLDPQSVAFLFQRKHKHLLLKLSVANEVFNAAIDAIRVRSDIHLNQFQPRMDAAGFAMGQAISGEQIYKAVGDRIYHTLKGATDILVEQVDKAVLGGDELQGELIEAFSEKFSAKEVFSFEMLDEPANAFTSLGGKNLGD